MPTWTKDQLREYQARRSSPRTEPEPYVRCDALGEAPGEVENPGRIVVRITSCRTRLLDPDNVSGGTKYFIDGLRYAGLIPGDRPDQIELQVSQVKVASKQEERTEIEISHDRET